MSLFRRKHRLSRLIEKLSETLERMRLQEYLEYLSSPRRVFFRTLLMGIARGLGFAIGFTILGALILFLLKRSFLNQLPVIGELIEEIIEFSAKR